ncbi:aryl-sulfate sulfotransferase, partial [Rubrivirga sp.]|uniref:aryl-sulfate sulfotransferase n=1 Tax=Rubrivirga sp. TaxID=1885344 RepID=UPI003C774F84
FDNGDNRAYGAASNYSRAVQYRIDEDAMTIQQVWSYGKDRGAETFSRIVSDVDYLPGADHVLFSPGAIQGAGGPEGRILEIDRASNVVVFDATVRAPTAPFGITFHRAERLPLYPN